MHVCMCCTVRFARRSLSLSLSHFVRLYLKARRTRPLSRGRRSSVSYALVLTCGANIIRVVYQISTEADTNIFEDHVVVVVAMVGGRSAEAGEGGSSTVRASGDASRVAWLSCVARVARTAVTVCGAARRGGEGGGDTDHGPFDRGHLVLDSSPLGISWGRGSGLGARGSGLGAWGLRGVRTRSAGQQARRNAIGYIQPSQPASQPAQIQQTRETSTHTRGVSERTGVNK